jgi:hypothetical protein
MWCTLFDFLTPGLGLYSKNHQVVMDCCIGENKYFSCQGVNISNSSQPAKYIKRNTYSAQSGSSICLYYKH